MAGNTFGTLFKVTTFGESHGAAIGAVIDGCPAGIPLAVEDITAALNAVKPSNSFETSRNEVNKPELLSGVFEGKTLGLPIAVLIRNIDARPHDYEALKMVYRPGHADFAYEAKYRRRDWRGGGRASGREAAARIAAGVVAKKVLTHYTGSHSIVISAAAIEVAGIACEPLYPADEIPAAIREKLTALKQSGDSGGAVVQCTIRGVPAGLGEPVFDKLEAELGKAVLSIGSIKGVAFGAGFRLARMTGAEANAIDENHHGGIAGGISDGRTIIFQAAVKPVPSISKEQFMENTNGQRITYALNGRYDVCLYRRVIPVIEAMTTIVLADMVLRQRAMMDDTGFEPVTSTV